MTRKPQLSDESLVFLIHSALVFSGVKKENRYTLAVVHMSLKVIGTGVVGLLESRFCLVWDWLWFIA